MDLGVWYRNLCSFFCAKLSIKEQWADFWDQDVFVQKRSYWLFCAIPVLKLMSSSIWRNWLLTRSHNRSQWFLTLLIQHGSLPVLLEPVLWFYFILRRTNSRICCQTSEWKKKKLWQILIYSGWCLSSIKVTIYFLLWMAITFLVTINERHRDGDLTKYNYDEKARE